MYENKKFRKSVIAAINILLLSCLALNPTWAYSSGTAVNSAEGGNEIHGQKTLSVYRDKAINALRSIVQQEEGTAKIHAAEILADLGYDKDILEHSFLEELSHCDQESAYWAGVYCVLVKTTDNEQLRQTRARELYKHYAEKKYKNTAALVDALARVKYIPSEQEEKIFKTDIQSSEPTLAPLAQWVLANSENPGHLLKLSEMLLGNNETTRRIAAYALSRMDRLAPDAFAYLTKACEEESIQSSAKPYMLCALYIHSDEHNRELLKLQLMNYLHERENENRADVCYSLVRMGTSKDLGYLVNLLEDKDPDVRSQAAYAVLRIERREMPNLLWPDWLVVAVYAVTLLLIGWIYSLKNKSCDDYLLGGRKMKSWAVGISLFATLLSTLSYLMLPGEMIKHGPMFLTAFASYPFIFFVVGWFLIPAFMKMKITSANELLENRFGAPIVSFAAFYFISMRLLWMATIIFTTVSLVLIPMSGINSKYAIILSTLLGIITIIYTALGGLKAVVLTSVIQTFILLLGALISLAVIVYHFGSFEVCIPNHWLPNWDKPSLGFDPNARISMMSMVVMFFLWYVCTAGSDQMTIQRYLATENIKEARKMFAYSLSSDLIINPLLAILGFGLLAFFKENPHFIPDGETISSGADMLFPRFIVLALPAGLSGLVVAGILSAGMSSLSSGINSISSVLTVDIFSRFKKNTDNLTAAKFNSWLIGIVVILLSILVAKIEGNLLEVVQKVVNLFASPLFILFFMAIFVPFSTTTGTITGSLLSLVMGGLIVFEQIDLSFTWITPLALGTGILGGILVSGLSYKKARRLDLPHNRK